MKDKMIIQFEKTEPEKITINETIRLVVSGGVELRLNKESGLLSLHDKKGTLLSEVDFPTEKIIKNAYYDYASQELVLEFENAPSVRIPIKTDLDNYYTKEEANELLENKYNKEDVYTKEQIDEKLEDFDSTNYSVLVGQEDGELYKMNNDGTLNKEEKLSEEVESVDVEEVETLEVGTSTTINVESDEQVPTSKAVKQLIETAIGDIESLLEAI